MVVLKRDGEVVGDISQEWGKVIRVVPAPAGQAHKIVLVNEPEPIDIVGQKVPHALSIGSGIEVEVIFVEEVPTLSVLVAVHLFESQQSLLLMPDLQQELFLQLIFKVALLPRVQFVELRALVFEKALLVLGNRCKQTQQFSHVELFPGSDVGLCFH